MGVKTVTTHICDRCGRESGKYRKAEICFYCAKEFRKWFESFMSLKEA